MPTRLKLLRGNPGRHKINDKEPKPGGVLTDPLDWMSESQKAGWTYAIENAPEGLLKKLDQSVMVVWVVAEDLHRQASMMLEKYGILMKTPITGEPMQSPYLPVVNRQAVIMLRAAAELGFTPSSRCRVQLEGQPVDDRWAGFFSGA